MNVYDTANNLAREIKESDEYKKYLDLKSEIANDVKKKEKLEEFEKERYMSQIAAMQGKPQDEEIKKMEEKYSELITDSKMKEYFEAEMKFNIMISDVNRIIAEAVKEVL